MSKQVMNLILSVASVLVLLSVCSCQTDDSIKESTKYVSDECSRKLMRINSLGQFAIFMYHYDVVTKQTEKPKRGLFDMEKGLRQCFDIEEQLRALQEIVASREGGVCRMEFIERLSDFHLKYLVSTRRGSDEMQQQQVIATRKIDFASHIFSLLAHQVAYVCKSKLSTRIKDIQAQGTDCSSLITAFLPQATAPAAETVAVDADESQTTIGDQEEEKEEEEEDMSFMASFLENFHRVEDLALITRGGSPTASEPYFDVIVSPEVLAKIDTLKQKCRQREPLYSALFDPIVTLAQFGYEISEPSVDSVNPNSNQARVLKCWLATAQLCQGILRTHISVNNKKQDDEDEDEQQKKLVEIKFGKVPEDVDSLSTSQAQTSVEKFEYKGDSFDEISSEVVELVKRKASIGGRIKRKMLNWAKRFVESHVDIGAIRDESAKQFVDALTRDDSESDSSVAFAGNKKNQGAFLPGRLITDDADTIVQTTSFLASKGIALMISSVVALTLSAVFVYFTLYGLITSLKGTQKADTNGNFKSEWRRLRDERMKTIDDKVHRRGWKDKWMVYKSPTG